jgi:misacylated tRNA(Ala) deacylase
MTEQLYHTDSYLKEFEAVVSRAEGKDVSLDRTAFYPASGGQPGDTGVIVAGGIEYKVVSVTKKGDDIMHSVDREGIMPGEKVTCLLDWGRRYRLMRSHTACHVLSYVFNTGTGALITGNQIALDKCRIDFDLEDFDRERIKSFEKKANGIISEEVSVTTRFLPREEAFQIPSVLKLKNVLPPSVDTIRIVQIGSHDIQACGGTHVKNTSEIGGIAITSAENKGKNNRRVYFVLKD